MKQLFSTIIVCSILLCSCKKEPETTTDNTNTANSNLKSEVLVGFSENVAQATYNDLQNKSSQLYTAIQIFDTATTDINLTTCKQLWRDTRSAWEQSEGFLFGPAANENIDPRIDTWPVDYNSLDSVLNSSAIFTDNYIESLTDALRGFHPIEYLLFGVNGTKTASQFTIREKEYLVALAFNLNKLTGQLADGWNTTMPDNYYVHVTEAGTSNSVYTTKRAIFEEIVNAMIGICDEVANGKIEEPFVAQNPLLEESPFASNSITDFTNNILSVQNVYLGKYNIDGKGLENIVRESNLSLDGTIKNKINAAIAALENITVPFGQAIVSQQIQVANAQDAINDLKTELENNLLPYIQQYTN